MPHGFIFFLSFFCHSIDKQNTSDTRNSNVDVIMTGSEFEKNRTSLFLFVSIPQRCLKSNHPPLTNNIFISIISITCTKQKNDSLQDEKKKKNTLDIFSESNLVHSLQGMNDTCPLYN